MFWKSTGEVKFISSSHPLYVFTLTPKCVFIVSSACVETTATCMLVYCSWTHIRHLMHANEFYSCRIMLNQKRANSHREKANHVSFFFFSSAVHVEQNNSKSSFYFLSYLFVEKLASAKEENLGMHQVLDQTLQELNSIWKVGKRSFILWHSTNRFIPHVCLYKSHRGLI